MSDKEEKKSVIRGGHYGDHRTVRKQSYRKRTDGKLTTASKGAGKAIADAISERLKMEFNKCIINGIEFSVRADESIISQAQLLFRAIKTIPVEKIRDGYKFEIGFSVFICITTDDGYKIVVPDYVNSPFLNTTDDLTIALWILLEQIELLNMYGIEGASTRFDNEIVIAKNALENPIICLQRYSDLGKGASGWCVEALEEKSDGTFKTIATEEYESIYAYQLLKKRPALIKVLALPYDFIVAFDGDKISEILNESNKSVIAEMKEMGGYCDCEVLLNCYEKYDID